MASMAETAELTVEESAALLGTAEKLYASLEKELPGIQKNRFDIHVIGPGESDAEAWNLIGLKPGPAFVVEVSAGTAFGDLPESGYAAKTPLEHGLTLIVQPDRNSFSIQPLIGTLGAGGWSLLDQKSDSAKEATTLGEYFAELRKHGRWYDQPETIQGWARFGKDDEAQMAFEQRMIKSVLHTPEMEEAIGLAIQKITGKDYAAAAGISAFMTAFIDRDITAAKNAASQLMTTESLDERLMKALDRVEELQKETVDTFENHSSWSLRAPKDITVSPSLKRILKVAGTVAGGTVAIGGGSVLLSEAANPVDHEPIPMAAPVPTSIPEFSAHNEAFWNDTQSTRSPKGFAVRDLLIALKLPTQSESVLPLNQNDMRFLQEGGIQKFAEQWVQSLPDEIRQNIEDIATRVEVQAISMQDAVVEAGQALAADPKALVWLAEVAGVTAVGSFAIKHPKEFLYGFLTVVSFVGCVSVGVGEIPTPVAPVNVQLDESAQDQQAVQEQQKYTAAIEKAMSVWGSFAIQGHTHEIKNDITLLLDSDNNIELVHPSLSQESVDMDIAYTIVSASVEVEGEEYPTLFFVRYDSKTGMAEAFLLQTATIEGKEITFDVGYLIDGDKEAHLAKFQFVLDASDPNQARMYIREKANDPSSSLIALVAVEGSGITQMTKVLLNILNAAPEVRPTLEPTPTPDPLAGAPEGATDKKNGEWIKEVTENGKTNTFVWTEKTDALTGEIVFSGWTREITDNEGIPVVDFVYDDIKDIGSIHVYVSDKIIGNANLPLFIHTNKTPEQGNDYDLTSKAQVSLFNRINGRNPSGQEMHDFLTKMLNGNISIDFFTVDSSQTYSVKFNPDFRPQIFITDWDSLEGEPDITNNPIGISLRSKILGVDTDGNLMGVIATNVPLDTLTEKQWSEIILWHTASIVDHKDQGKQYFNRTIGSWVAFAGRKNPNTWIEQVPPPAPSSDANKDAPQVVANIR